MHDFIKDKRFEGMRRLEDRVLLSSPTPHEADEGIYIDAAYKSGWLTTAGENIDRIEEEAGAYMGRKAVALVNGTAAVHLAVKLAAEKVYGSSSGVSTPSGRGYGGALLGRRVFVSDMTFGASVNPIVYEGGEPVFIDSETDTWNMDPAALRRAFEIFPDVKIVIFVHLYGVPGKIKEVEKICAEHGALLIEDAAESLGAFISTADGKKPAGSFGSYGILSFNGNKIITGASGGMLLVPDIYSYEKAKKWSTQAREAVPWYEHEELGYNYRISNITAGIIRGQWGHLEEHIKEKQAVFDRYKRGLEGLPVTVHGGGSCWLSCALINKEAVSENARSSRRAVYRIEKGKSCPTEILEALECYNCEGRPLWKPMHLQPLYRGNAFVVKAGTVRGNYNVYRNTDRQEEVTNDLFHRGLCLPSDNKMTEKQQEVVMEVVRRCFA